MDSRGLDRDPQEHWSSDFSLVVDCRHDYPALNRDAIWTACWSLGTAATLVLNDGMGDQSILWRRLDRPGHEFLRMSRKESWWRLTGTAVFAHEEEPCRLDYLILCDLSWQTVSGRVTGWLGTQEVEIDVSVESPGRWLLNGEETPAVSGCTDLDLNFSPSTNLLPIRRLDLAVGEQAEVKAAWLRFPSFTLERLEQIYSRIDAETYRYESAGGAFVTEIQVNAAGLVTSYPNFCEAETGE